MKNKLGTGIIFLFLIGACGGERGGVTEQEVISYNEAPEFQADSAFHYIQKQVDFGPRVPNTAPHTQTKEWLISKFTEFGLEVETQDFQAATYDGNQWNLSNIIASYNPNSNKRILLAAHWDTRRVADKDTERREQAIDGANDGGSGVGVLLEIARILGTGTEALDIGVDFILFDGEDDGIPENFPGGDYSKIWWCLGSQHWSQTPHEMGYKAYYGVLLDMVGGKGARFHKEGYSMAYAKNIVNKVWGYSAELGYSDYFVMREAPEIIDDHLFVNKDAGIPMINIVEFSPDYGFGYYHHTHSDNMELIDKRTLKAVGQTVLFTLFQE